MFRKVFIALAILCLFSGAAAKADDTAYAYCPLGEGYVFLYDTVDGFQVITNLKCNEKLQVLDASDKTRIKVRTTKGQDGWVPRTSLNVPATPNPSQAAAPVSPVPQPPQAQAAPQTQAAPQPPVQPQRQPARQRRGKSETQQANAAQPPVQPAVQPEVQPQQSQAAPPQIPAPPLAVSQPESAAPAQNPPESEPLPPVQAVGALPLSSSEPQAQPQSDVKLEATAHPQPEALPQPEPQPQPEAQPQPNAQPQPEAQPPLKAQEQFQQPSPAATAFTPFSRLGYEEVPRLEAYAGYSFLNAGTSGLSGRQNLSGVEAAVDIHINRWIAGELDGAAYIKTLNILNVGTFAYHSFLGMAGPRINIRKMFFHALGGIDHLAGSGNFYSVSSTLTNNALAGGGGGGVQWNVTRRLALRTSADYVLTRFEGLTQNNVRFTLGIVFEAGTVRAE